MISVQGKTFTKNPGWSVPKTEIFASNQTSSTCSSHSPGWPRPSWHWHESMGASLVPSTKGWHDATKSFSYETPWPFITVWISQPPLLPFSSTAAPMSPLEVVPSLMVWYAAKSFTASQGTVKVVKYCSNENNKKGASHAARSTVVMWVSHQLGKSHWLSSSWYTMATKHFNSWLHATCKQEIATSQKGNKLVDVV